MPRTIGDALYLLAQHLTEPRGDSATLKKITKQLGEIMSNQEQLNQRTQLISEQVAEVVTEVQNLKDQVAGQDVDFTALDAAIQPLADIVPDPVDPDVPVDPTA